MFEKLQPLPKEFISLKYYFFSDTVYSFHIVSFFEKKKEIYIMS